MGQELLYSVLARPTLRPSDLVFRRRVDKMAKNEDSKGAATEEQLFEDDNQYCTYSEGRLSLVTKKQGARIDDII